MQHYSAFELDLRGHVIGRIDLTCKDDDDARKQAERLLDDHDIEVWRLDRRIAVFRCGKTPQ
jgi:hypothetical protein